MENKFVLTVAVDGTTGEFNILFGNGIELPKESIPGATVSVRLGGGISLPILLNMFLTTFKTVKDKAMENPALEEKDRPAFEQEIYDMLNVAVGSYLDQGFPFVNEYTSLTEEACVEYGLDPKIATNDQIIEAENKFIEEHPERAAQTYDMQLETPEQIIMPNREQRRKTAKEKRS